MVTREILELTKTYKTLNSVQKIVYRKLKNLKKLNQALTVIGNIGFDIWSKDNSFCYINKLLVADLLSFKEFENFKVEGIEPEDYPKYTDAFIVSATCKVTGRKLSVSELNKLTDENPDLVNRLATEHAIVKFH